MDVLEHIKEDKAALASIHPLLKENGHVLVTVPAYPWLWSIQDTVHHHQRRYNKKSLLDTVPSNLYEVQKISFYNTSLFPLAAIARAKDILLMSKAPTGADIPGKFINSLLKNLFSFEKHLVNRSTLPFGLSLYLVLKKRVDHV